MSTNSTSASLAPITELRHPPKENKVGQAIGSVLSYAIMGLFAAMTIYPFIWLIMNSFKETQEFLRNVVGFPMNPVLANYPGAWKLGEFSVLLPNSILYTGVTTVGTIVLSFMASFAFAKIPRKATGPLYASFLIGILITIESLMIPLFIMMTSLGLADTQIGVLIVYIGIGLPTAIYLGTEYIKSIPTALVESARIDGAGFFRIFWSIILPMTRPVMLTLAILMITGTWNEFALINIIASSTEVKSLPLGVLRFSGDKSSQYGLQFAALTIGMLPMLIFYLVFQKHITKGVAAGAVKG